ncbi:MAG: carbohydrate kinase family protein [Actinobacteria bacterium]|nr:carbohydrate kinase family protein [Actinomycetota bacterium]
MVVCTVGDLTLDVVVRLAGPLSSGGDTNAEIQLSPGGQAANVAAWAAALGARARFLGKRGNDEPGRLALAGLEAVGVEVLGPIEGRNGVICALVSPDGERSMAADRGAAATLRPEEIDPVWLEGCNHLFVSGYALLREPTRSAALIAVELGRTQGAEISVDLATWSAIREAGAAEFRDAVATVAPDVVFANESELEIFGELLPDTHWIVKRGARGCSFGENDLPALPVERVVDTTGAGDALAAGWIVGGPELALEAAARCVQRLGTMP